MLIPDNQAIHQRQAARSELWKIIPENHRRQGFMAEVNLA
jgi:hypothetical protein